MSDGNTVEKTVRPALNGGHFITGNPGNKGGTGRPKNEIREACAESFDQAKQVALDIIAKGTATDADKLRALDILGKYGGLQQVDQTSGDKPLPTPVDFGSMTVEQKKEYLSNLPK